MFEQVVDDPRTDPATLRRVAHWYFEIGRFGKAAEVMRVAVARMPEPDAATTNTLAWTLERDHQTDEARQYAEAAHALDPSYGPAVRLLAHLDRRAGDMERAARRLTDQLHRYPSESDWGLRYELAAVCDRLGQYDEAWTALCQAKSQLASQAADTFATLILHSPPAMGARAIGHRSRSAALAPGRRLVDAAKRHRVSDRLSPLGHHIARTDHRLAMRTRSTPTRSGILPSQFIEPLGVEGRRRDERHHRTPLVRPTQLVAGRETFYQLTENYLDQEVGERLLIEKNPLLTADLALPLRLFPEASLLVAPARPARRGFELSVHDDPAQLDQCASHRCRRGLPVLRRYHAPLAVVATAARLAHMRNPLRANDCRSPRRNQTSRRVSRAVLGPIDAG